jgi:hypothetical protein
LAGPTVDRRPPKHVEPIAPELSPTLDAAHARAAGAAIMIGDAVATREHIDDFEPDRRRSGEPTRPIWEHRCFAAKDSALGEATLASDQCLANEVLIGASHSPS